MIFIFLILSLKIIKGLSVESPNPISVVIEETCLKQSSTVDIKFLSNDTKVELILKHLNKMPIRIETKILKHHSNELKKCNILVIKTLKDFENFNKFLSPEIYDFRGIFFVIFVNGKLEEIEKIFTIFWSHQIVNVNAILVDTFNVTSMATFMPFQNHKCNDTTPKIINQFKDGKFTTNNFFVDKLENLQECPLRVLVTKELPYIILSHDNKPSGRDIDLMRGLGAALNFKVDFIIHDDHGFLHDNGSAGGIFGLLQNGSGDMTVCDWWLTSSRVKFFDATTGYIQDDIVLVIPPRAELSAVEKLIYPLNFLTWVMLAVSLGIGSLVISFVTLQTKSIQTFVFGEYEKYPLFTMFGLLIGRPQFRNPTKNFARFILLNFLAFTMIIRTAYEGAMYQFMQSDKKYKEPKTIEELVELDYKFHVMAVSMDLFQHFTNLKNNFNPVNEKQRAHAMISTHDPNYKGSVVITKGSTIYENEQNRNGAQFIVLSERIMSIQSVVYTRKNFYLVTALNKKINEFKSAGLIDHWHNNVIDQKFLKIATTSTGPHSLELHHVIGCFQLIGVGFLASVLIFAAEIFYFRHKENKSLVVQILQRK